MLAGPSTNTIRLSTRARFREGFREGLSMTSGNIIGTTIRLTNRRTTSDCNVGSSQSRIHGTSVASVSLPVTARCEGWSGRYNAWDELDELDVGAIRGCFGFV